MQSPAILAGLRRKTAEILRTRAEYAVYPANLQHASVGRHHQAGAMHSDTVWAGGICDSMKYAITSNDDPWQKLLGEIDGSLKADESLPKAA